MKSDSHREHQEHGAVNAKDRIGNGPWFNANGVQIAANVADLHSDNNKIRKETGLDEKGMAVKGRGDTPSQQVGGAVDGRSGGIDGALAGGILKARDDSGRSGVVHD